MSADLDLSQFEGMTPGPWGVEQTEHTSWIGPMRRSGDGKVAEIVTMIDRSGIKSEYLIARDANARAIAAVPALIAEVRRLGEMEETWKRGAMEHSKIRGERDALRADVERLTRESLSKTEIIAQLDAEVAASSTKLAELERDRERVDWLLANIPGSAFRAMGIVYSDGAKRADLDAAMQTNPNP